MTGTITRRGRKSWRLKYDLPRDAATGRRRIAYKTVKGTRKDAERELRNCLTALDHGIVIEPSRITVGAYLDQWHAETAAHRVSPKSLERYGELIANQIKPHLGAVALQKLRPADVKRWHSKLLSGERPLAPRTVQHAHQVLHKALADAAAVEIVPRNVAALVKPPPNPRKEIEILTASQIGDVLDRLEGSAMHPIAMVAFTTGLRRGEIAALRWSDLDLDGAKLRVERTLELTRDGLRFKPPKTDAGVRTLGLPEAAIAVLRDHRRRQLETWLALGRGRMPDDALVFGNLDGAPRSPHAITDSWRRHLRNRNLPKVSFHALRHSHASALIAAGVDVVRVSRRLGHGSPAITLGVYSHLFDDTDDGAAAAIDGVLGAN